MTKYEKIVQEMSDNFSWDDAERLEVLRVLNEAYNEGVSDALKPIDYFPCKF